MQSKTDLKKIIKIDGDNLEEIAWKILKFVR